MANSKHAIELPVPIQQIWAYISEINQWAPTIPGYVSHEIVNETKSIWAIRGDLGIMKKTANLQVDITEWVEPTKVAFTFKSLTGEFVGNGQYEAEAIDDRNTRITGYLEIEPDGAKGPMATMQKTVLKKFVPKTTKDITTAVAKKVI